MTTSDPSDEVAVEVTPATPDLVCWLWAAFPQRRGRLDTRRIAEVLGVSASTVRRWIRQAADTELNEAGMRILKRRAILRGRGTYLWPPLDPSSIARSAEQSAIAEQKIQHGSTARDQELGRTMPHRVALMCFPQAHVFGISYHRHESDRHGRKSMLRLNRVGEVLQVVDVDSMWEAIKVKESALSARSSARCIAPRELVKVGRTTTWMEAAGPLDLEPYAR